MRSSDWSSDVCSSDLAGVRFLAEEILHDLAHARHTGHAADEHDFVDVGRADAGVLDRLLARLERALDAVFYKAFEVGALDGLDQVLRPVARQSVVLGKRVSGRVELGVRRVLKQKS